MMDNTKDKVIKYQDEVLDNIEAILSLQYGDKIVGEEGNVIMICKDVKSELTYSSSIHLVDVNTGAMTAYKEGIGALIVSMLRDNFLGHNEWRVVK